MAAKTENKKLINVGKYLMPEDAVLAAYTHQRNQYLMEDARRHLDAIVFNGEENPDKGHRIESCRWLETIYGVTYKQAVEMLPVFVRRFLDEYDCDISENDMWAGVIERVLSESGPKVVQTVNVGNCTLLIIE